MPFITFESPALIKYTSTPIVKADTIGFIILSFKFKFNLMLLLKLVKHMVNATTWHTIELIPAPIIPMLGLLIKIMFKINLINAPTANAIAGVFVLFKPYSPPLIV